MPQLGVVAAQCTRSCCFALPPTIAEISGNQAVTEGGKPTPNITWTRLSDNSVTGMTLTDIRRQDAGKHRCTAVNGIESPATSDVSIVVHCECCNLQCRD